MGVKDILKKQLYDAEMLLVERHRASIFSVVAFGFLFFLNYFSIAAQVGNSFILLGILPLTAVAFLISLGFFVYFAIKKMVFKKVASAVYIVAGIVISLLIFALMIPFLVSHEQIVQIFAL